MRALDFGQRLFFARERRRRRVALCVRATPRLRAARPSPASRPAPRVEAGELGDDLGRRLRQPLRLLLVERDLLLTALVVELALVRLRAQRVRPRVGFGQLDAQALEIALDLGEPRGAEPLPIARRRELLARDSDGLTELVVALREQQLLPPPQLFAQPAIPPGLRGLPLERAARCRSSSKMRSSTRVRFCCAASSFSSA